MRDRVATANGVAMIFVWGGHPVHFPSSLREPTAFSGGGVVADIFPASKSITFPRFLGIFGTFHTFSGHLRIARRLWTLTEIQAHFPGLLTHSNHVTTSIHSRKKHLPKVWGGHGPLAPPGYATGNSHKTIGRVTAMVRCARKTT